MFIINLTTLYLIKYDTDVKTKSDYNFLHICVYIIYIYINIESSLTSQMKKEQYFLLQ